MKVLVLVLVSIAVTFAQDKKCGSNEEFNNCGTPCEPKCGEQEPVGCIALCLVGVCQCKSGYMRGLNGCVLAKDCPKTRACPDTNAVRMEFGADPNCQLTCDDLKKGVEDKICNRRGYHDECYCKDGFAPLTTGGKCVAKDSCP